MAKSLLYKLFGLRKLTAETRDQLRNEGIVIDEEGTSCALSYRNFKGPRNSSHRGWESVHVGSLVVTQQTFYVQFPYMLVCKKPVEYAATRLELELKNPTKLVMKFTVEDLFEDATGGLTCHWRTHNAPAIHAHLREMQHNEDAK
jgi:hypothetical protein